RGTRVANGFQPSFARRISLFLLQAPSYPERIVSRGATRCAKEETRSIPRERVRERKRERRKREERSGDSYPERDSQRRNVPLHERSLKTLNPRYPFAE
ncbi:hypothetical protein X777_07927, partial [Ooceraea biroi]